MWDIHNIIPPKHVHRWTYETKIVTSLRKKIQRWMGSWYAYGNYNVTSLGKTEVEIVQSHVCTEYSSEDYNMVQLLKGANDIINNNP